MNRRGFFKNIFRAAAAVVLPTVLLNYDPVKQAIVQPKTLGSEYLLGHKGSQFLTTGFVYAPYIPLITSETVYTPQGVYYKERIPPVLCRKSAFDVPFLKT